VFAVAAPIQSPAKCEVRSVIRFLSTTSLLEKFKWDILGHPPYSPDLAPSNFRLFLYLKKHLAGKKFDDIDEAQEDVMTWFRGQAADFYDSGDTEAGSKT